MDTLKAKLVVLIHLIGAWVMLIITAMPVSAADEYRQACKKNLIEDSFKQTELSEKDISEIQTRLKSGEFMSGSVNGKLNNRTIEGLLGFCLHIGPEEKSIPQETPKKPTAELANFLFKKLSESRSDEGDQGSDASTAGEDVKDDESPMPCEIAAIAKSMKGLEEQKEVVQKIQALLKSGGYLTDWADGILGPETYHGIVRLCQYLSAVELLNPPAPGQAPADALKQQLTEKLDETAGKLRHQASMISVSAIKDCGCSKDFAAPVYGFLPYWLADKNPQEVDFSVLDRIGFHALQLGTTGEISNSSLWKQAEKSRGKAADSEGNVAGFIAAAHKHRVAVDINFYASSWMDWESDEIDNAIAAIAETVDYEFSTAKSSSPADSFLVRWLRKLLPFIEDTSLVKVDGVNLYFDNYAIEADQEYRECAVDQSDQAELETGPWCNVSDIVKDLSEKLNEDSSPVKLNIILGLKWSGINAVRSGVPGAQIAGLDKRLFSRLETILTETLEGSEAPMVENLFVFLPRNTSTDEAVTGSSNNTSYSKKYLRRIIEDAFDGKGVARRTVLRKTVPILAASSDSVELDYFKEDGQFFDDLIYLQDNFAGAGLWPLPLTPRNEQASQIGQRLQDAYGAEIEPGSLEEDLDGAAQTLCNFACPNRWGFRLSFDFLLAGLAIYGLLAIRNCRLREFYKKKSGYFFSYGGVTAMVFAVSLVCDPFWKDSSDYVMWGVLLTLLGYPGFNYIRKSMRPKYP